MPPNWKHVLEKDPMEFLKIYMKHHAIKIPFQVVKSTVKLSNFLSESEWIIHIRETETWHPGDVLPGRNSRAKVISGITRIGNLYWQFTYFQNMEMAAKEPNLRWFPSEADLIAQGQTGIGYWFPLVCDEPPIDNLISA